MQAKWMTALILGSALTLSTSAVRANDDAKVPAVQPLTGPSVTTAAAPTAPAEKATPAVKAPPGAPMSDAELAVRREHMQQEMETKLNNPPPWLLEKFDADKDGKLNDAEKVAAKAEMNARQEQYLADLKAGKVPGTGGPGAAKARGEALADFSAKLDAGGPEVLAKFDTDKDGKISPAEKAAALQHLEERLQKAPGAGGAGPGDGKGPLSPEQKKAYIMSKLDTPGPEMLKRFDQDGDGKLSADEKSAAVGKIMAEHENKPGVGPK